jgi:hypothetical protein
MSRPTPPPAAQRCQKLLDEILRARRRLDLAGVTKNFARGIAVAGRLGAALRGGGWRPALGRLRVDPLDVDQQFTIDLLILAADGADRAVLRAELRAKLVEAWDGQTTFFNVANCLTETLYREISAADRADPPTAGPAGEQIGPVSRAIALLDDARREGRPIPTVPELARIVGCHRATLYRDEQVMAAWRAFQPNPPPRGYRTKSGSIEAEDLD